MFRFALAMAFVIVTARGEPLGFFDEPPGTLGIRLTEEGLNSLRMNSRKFVPAVIKALAKPWQKVQLRLKGTGTFQPIDAKPSLTIDFPNSRIHLTNSVDDPSCLNEFVGSYLFASARDR